MERQQGRMTAGFPVEGQGQAQGQEGVHPMPVGDQALVVTDFHTGPLLLVLERLLPLLEFVMTRLPAAPVEEAVQEWERLKALYAALAMPAYDLARAVAAENVTELLAWLSWSRGAVRRSLVLDEIRVHLEAGVTGVPLFSQAIAQDYLPQVERQADVGGPQHLGHVNFFEPAADAEGTQMYGAHISRWVQRGGDRVNVEGPHAGVVMGTGGPDQGPDGGAGAPAAAGRGGDGGVGADAAAPEQGGRGGSVPPGEVGSGGDAPAAAGAQGGAGEVSPRDARSALGTDGGAGVLGPVAGRGSGRASASRQGPREQRQGGIQMTDRRAERPADHPQVRRWQQERQGLRQIGQRADRDRLRRRRTQSHLGLPVPVAQRSLWFPPRMDRIDLRAPETEER